MREVAGEFGAHLKLISRTLGVELHQRGNSVTVVAGGAPALALAVRVVEQLYALAASGQPVTPTDVHQALRLLQADPTADLGSYMADALVLDVDGRPIAPKTPGQRLYVRALRASEVVFGVGPAGTGKTYLAVAMAVAALKRGEVRRIILTRPAVEAGEKLGFLPGDLAEKVDPYIRPLFDALEDMMPADRVQKLLEKRVIEVAPLAFMRGRTLSHAYVVLDEAQNTTAEQMKMFLTRLGEGSRMVITGDVTQIDLPKKQASGLIQALDVLAGVDGIAVVRFGSQDVIRHPLVGRIVDAYGRFDATREAGGRSWDRE